MGLELWRRLELDRFCEADLDRPDDPADVPWSRVAALLAVNRLCAPGSELAIEERWFPSTALDDLLAIEPEKVNDTRLDRLLPHKTGSLRPDQQLCRREAAKDPMMRCGYSRDHRPICKQVVIALIAEPQ